MLAKQKDNSWRGGREGKPPLQKVSVSTQYTLQISSTEASSSDSSSALDLRTALNE